MFAANSPSLWWNTTEVAVGKYRCIYMYIYCTNKVMLAAEAKSDIHIHCLGSNLNVIIGNLRSSVHLDRVRHYL